MPGTSMSGASQAFDTAYPDHPWANLDRNQRQWFDPILRDVYREKNVYGQFTNFVMNNGAANAATMTISGLYDLHANTDPIGARQNWLPAAHVDSWQVDITFSNYANKVAYHKYDKIISFWKQTGRMDADTLRDISNDKLGQNIADTLDLLSRNSLFDLPYATFGGDMSLSNIGQLQPGNTLETGTLELIHLGMQNRSVPYAQNPSGDIGSIVCITSPGVMFDLRRQTNPRDWLWLAQYAKPSVLWNYEIGTFQNMRFVVTPKAQLWNTGAVTYQTTVVAPIQAGDGAPSTKVDRTRRAGQSGVTHYIQLKSDADMTQFSRNQMVTIHTLRGDGSTATSVSGGVDYTDGTKTDRIIESVDVGNKRLSFKKPIMTPFVTDLGSTTYAYVTIGVHVHASIFIGAPDVVAVGMARPLELNFLPPVDDRNAIWRISWDLSAGWNNYNPDGGEVVFTAGSSRIVGPLLQ